MALQAHVFVEGVAAAFFFCICSVYVLSTTSWPLRVHHYHKTCPDVEGLVFETVKEAILRDVTVPAGLVRMHFHDCFIEGCDGSVLIDSTPGNQAEKDAPPNLSLHGFYVIDNAKAKIEGQCPGVVSCADILAVAARDAVVMSGGPSWRVRKGRLDGRVSKAAETKDLPAPTFNLSQLVQSFASRNLSILDVVTLSGGHTLGFSHCSSFNHRLFHFSPTNDIDPSMDPHLAQQLRKQCPANNQNNGAGSFLDDTTLAFDNQYYVDLIERKGIFTSDQSLFDELQTRGIVYDYALNKELFFANFAMSMQRMGQVGLKGMDEGEIRANCRVINSS